MASMVQGAYTLNNAISRVLAHSHVDQDMIDTLTAITRDMWIYQVNKYRSEHPGYQERMALPVAVAMPIARWLVAIGLHRMYEETSRVWAEMGFHCCIDEYREESFNEED